MLDDNDKPTQDHEIEAARAFVRSAIAGDIYQLESAARSLSGDSIGNGKGWGRRQVLKIIRLELALALSLFSIAAVLFAVGVFGFWTAIIFGAAGLYRLALAVKHFLLARRIKRAIKAGRQITERLQTHQRDL